VEVDILEGRRGTRHVPVTDVIKSYFGLAVFMDLDALDQLLYGSRLTGVHIGYDTRLQSDLFTAIKSTPGIGSIALQRHALTRFRETIAQNINYSVTTYVTLAAIIAFGMVYNSARIQLSENARELASLLEGASGAGWSVLFQASGVNDLGQIVGAGIYNGEIRGFVASPAVPEPATFTLPTIASALLRRRRRT
jgi:small basic protein